MKYIALFLNIFLAVTISNELGWGSDSRQYWFIIIPALLLIHTIICIVSKKRN